MHVVVCIKQVPGTTEVKINPETNTLMREGVESVINPFDENALEAALVLKDTIGAKVTVVSMGPPQVESALKEAIGRGADSVVLLSDRGFAGADTLATSYALAEGIKTLPEKADIIMFGKQAIDGDTAQVGPGVAELLDLPVITYIRKLEVVGSTVKVERVFEDGFEKMEAAMPVVLTILKEMNVPRMASLKGKMRAKKETIKVLSAKDIKADPERIGLKGSPTQVVKIFTPPKKTGGLKLDGTAPLEAAKTVVEKLLEQKVL